MTPAQLATPPTVPLLPLVLFEPHPGLELALRQEGIPCLRAAAHSQQGMHAGRFVLYHSRRVSRRRLSTMLASGQIALDVDPLRRGHPGTPDAFNALVDHESTQRVWTYGNTRVSETVARFPKAAIRHRLIQPLRALLLEHGGVWMRIAPLPYPYRFAFNWRLDLDEPGHELDTLRTIAASQPLADCTTVFVCTAAYESASRVWSALRGFDVQPHGHYHTIYRDAQANRLNLERSLRVLKDKGFTPRGYAAPHGRWNGALNHAIESLGLDYSSEFQLGHDDWPSFPWLGDRFSSTLQIPIHPVCEGLFLESGCAESTAIAAALCSRIEQAEAAGETAFLYGHPEQRLGRMPEVVSTVARRLGASDRVWRVTLSTFAAWWRWRATQFWTVSPSGPRDLLARFSSWNPRHRFCLEIDRGDHTATVPVTRPILELHFDRLAYVRKQPRRDAPHPAPVPAPCLIHPRQWLRQWLDWERVTPTQELPDRLWRDRLKKSLRAWQESKSARTPSA